MRDEALIWPWAVGLLLPISTKCMVITLVIMARESSECIFLSLIFSLLFRQMFKFRSALYFHHEISGSLWGVPLPGTWSLPSILPPPPVLLS